MDDDRSKVKETLRKQLQLLAEASEKETDPLTLCELTNALVTTAVHLVSL